MEKDRLSHNADILTIPVAKNHRIIVTGKAIIYRTVCVKFKSKKILPTIPQTKDKAFTAVTLKSMISIGNRLGIYYDMRYEL